MQNTEERSHFENGFGKQTPLYIFIPYNCVQSSNVDQLLVGSEYRSEHVNAVCVYGCSEKTALLQNIGVLSEHSLHIVGVNRSRPSRHARANLKESRIFLTLSCDDGKISDYHVTCNSEPSFNAASCVVAYYEPTVVLDSMMIEEKYVLDGNKQYLSDNTTVIPGIVQHLIKGLFKYRDVLNRLEDKTESKIVTTVKQIVSWKKILYIFLLVLSAIGSVINRCPPSLQDFLLTSSVVRQLVQRWKQVQSMVIEGKVNHLSLRSKNTMWAVIVDVLVGVLLMHYIQKHITVVQLFDVFMIVTQTVMDNLKELLLWLMGVPAGLKLNYPLSRALGNFFQYHIYLWQTYIIIVRPVLEAMLVAMFSLGYVGCTLLLSMLSDLLSMATFHVYCFYVYAARLYNLQVSGLLSLWRLFRGKKWNVLRERVDSCSYQVDQLFLGTLIFTVLLFLLPTTFVYYVVFTTLRFGLLLLQSAINGTIRVLSVCPWHTIILRIVRPHLLAGDVSFRVNKQTNEDSFSLVLETATVPLQDVLHFSQPVMDSPSTDLKHVMTCALVGQLV